LASPRSNLHKAYTHLRFANVFPHFRQPRPRRQKQHDDDNNHNHNQKATDKQPSNQQQATNNDQPTTTNQQQPTNNNQPTTTLLSHQHVLQSNSKTKRLASSIHNRPMCVCGFRPLVRIGYAELAA